MVALRTHGYTYVRTSVGKVHFFYRVPSETLVTIEVMSLGPHVSFQDKKNKVD